MSNVMLTSDRDSFAVDVLTKCLKNVFDYSRRDAAKIAHHQVEHDVERDRSCRVGPTQHRQTSVGHRGHQVVDVERQNQHHRRGLAAEVSCRVLTI